MILEDVDLRHTTIRFTEVEIKRILHILTDKLDSAPLVERYHLDRRLFAELTDLLIVAEKIKENKRANKRLLKNMDKDIRRTR